MGRQVNFFLHEDDQLEFDLLLKSFGEVILVPYFQYQSKILTVEDTIIRNIKTEGSRIYLVRPVDFNSLQLEHFEKFGYWLLKDNQLPVLHFDRSIFKSDSIQRGRLYFQPQFVDNNGWVNKSDDFVKWADNIVKTVRRKLKNHKFDFGGWGYSEYVGKKALQWIIANNPESLGGGSELKVRR